MAAFTAIHDYPITLPPEWTRSSDENALVAIAASLPQNHTARRNDPDREDWIEAVLRADAIEKAVTARGGALYAALPHLPFLVPVNEFAERRRTVGKGPLLDFRLHLKPIDEIKGEEILQIAPRRTPYGAAEWFCQNACRWIVVAANLDPAEDPRCTGFPQLANAIDFYATTPFIWKNLGGRDKDYAAEKIPASSPGSKRKVPSDIGLAAVHTGGLSLLSEVVEMTYEYRVFVVAGKPISGAGAIEEHTPLDGNILRERGFSPLMRRNRKSMAEFMGLPAERQFIESRPSFAEFYRNEATRIAAEIAADPEAPRSYTLDLFLPAEQLSGTPRRAGIVELNPILRSGLYSADPYPVMDALLNEALNA